MDNTWIWVVSIAVAVLIGLICARVAGRKGHSGLGFGLLGFFLPLIGIIAVLLIRNRTTSS